MAESDRRPSAEDFEELVERVRRDPSSPAFVDLGDAYLSLGRPRDAAEVATTGLAVAPDSLEGRIVLARAMMALHQWKEAQAELLRVVKLDRNNRQGFVLLGEVLLRRSDFERALPVLQHAQNLDPANPEVLAMLRRARGGQPLDAPAPIPTPVAPKERPRAPTAPAAKPELAPPPAPARVAPPAPSPAKPAPPAQPPAPRPPPIVAREPVRDEATVISPPPEMARPAAAPMVAVDDGKSKPRPRVIPASKPVNAAAASLRQSAAVGETYLNDLLTGGLLDVPGVRTPDVAFDIKPDRRWGRSSTKVFVTLFIVLLVGVGGGTGWYYWSERTRGQAIERHRVAAAKAMVGGTWDGLEQSLAELRSALDREVDNPLTMAAIAEVTALETLLYGAESDRVAVAIREAGRSIDAPTEPGFRELVIARAALELAQLSSREDPVTALAAVRTSLDGWLETHPEDPWAQWLKAHAMLAAGARAAGMDALAKAAGGDDGNVLAMVDRADLLVDEGKYDEGMKLYEQVLAKTPDHPLAVMGMALARAERGIEVSAAMDDLNVRLDKELGPRVGAYRKLALALAYQGNEETEDPARFKESIDGAVGPTEPRFQARVALARAFAGELAPAAQAAKRIAWYGKDKAEPDPLLALVEGALLLASGLPAEALEVAKGSTVRAMQLRGQALLDLGKPAEALTELEAAAKAAPKSIDVQILAAQARALASTGRQREAALEALDKAALRFKTKLGRHVHGMTLFATGDVKLARRRLEQAIDGASETEPNPVIYRTHTVLAELDLAAGNLDSAAEHLEKAIKANSGYLPALTLNARVVLAQGDADRALALLEPVLREKKGITPQVELTHAEALMRGKDVSEEDKKAAIAALERAKAGGAPAAEIARIAELIDPDLADSMGVPKEESSRDHRREHRRRR